MKDGTLYEVRCPNNRWKGNTNKLTCNTLCGRITSTSMGEFHCRKCKVLYNFVINEDGEVTYFFEPTEVKKRFNKTDAEGRLLDLLNNQ